MPVLYHKKYKYQYKYKKRNKTACQLLVGCADTDNILILTLCPYLLNSLTNQLRLRIAAEPW